MKKHNLKINQKVIFSNTFISFNATVLSIQFITEDYMPREITINISVSFDDYNRLIDKNNLFFLEKENRKESALDRFEENKPVEIELILTENLLSFIQISMNEPKQLEAIFQKQNHSKREKELFYIQNWYALNVKQTVEIPNDLEGTLKMGYATTWDKLKFKQNNKVQFTPFFSQVYHFFKKKTQSLRLDNNQTIIKFTYPIDLHYVDCLVHVREEFQQILFYTRPPLLITSDQMPILMPLVLNLNNDIRIGNLDLDIKNEILYFKTYLDVEEANIKENWLELLFDGNIYQINKYYPIILSALNEK